MKRFCIATIIIVLSFISGNCTSSYAQPTKNPSTGKLEWGTYGKHTPASGTIHLSEDVYLKGSIQVRPGTELTITSDTDITIHNDGILESEAGESRMFTINSPSGDKECGSLIIRAAEGKKITIDGGANYKIVDTYILEADDGSRGLSSCISTGGSLTLENVIIQDVKGLDGSGGAIHISSKAAKPISLKNCIITRCYSQLGAAIFLEGTDKLTIEDSEISYCNSGGGSTKNSGGAIRTVGNVKASLYLTNVYFHHNYARRNQEYNHDFEKDGNGGALFWNARGTEDTKCVIKGCRFEYNKSDDNGGAIKSQGTLIFAEHPENPKLKTVISNNIAPVGAGLYIEGYTGNAGVNDARIIDYNLNQFLVIDNNIAPQDIHDNIVYSGGKGAGIHFYFGSDMTLEENSTIRVNMKGATITNNKAYGESSQGGGIYFENTSEENKYTFEINLNDGKIENNLSEGKGGGVYVFGGSVGYDTQTVTSTDSLKVIDNKAKEGAGIFIQTGNLTVYNGNISSNKINGDGNGAGIHIDGGSMTFLGGQVSLNKITGEGMGGGIYITGGNFTMGPTDEEDSKNKDRKIKKNISTDGGGVYLNNGNFELLGGEISDNTASRMGGGVFLNGEECIYELTSGKINANHANAGGGVYLANGSFTLVPVEENEEGDDAVTRTDSDSPATGNIVAEINANTAAEDGGGVYIAGGTFTMNGGKMNSNTATNGHGGGAYITKQVTSVQGSTDEEQEYIFVITGGEIKTNSALGNEDGTGEGGGVYINNGAMNVEAGYIEGNIASRDGGGVYINNGNVGMGDGLIKGNISQRYGGGVYVYNPTGSDTQKRISLSGGEIQENNADYGGGICVNGNIMMTIEDAVIDGNTALNGGGICLLNGAIMEFNSGKIINNKAEAEHVVTQTTAHNQDITSSGQVIHGIGGGVYLNSNTTMKFSEQDNLGLFGNTATNGADELFANGNNTTVNLPDVEDMSLTGFPGGGNLKWIKDYIEHDSGYEHGPYYLGNDGNGQEIHDTKYNKDNNVRYRTLLEQNSQDLPQLHGGIGDDDERSGMYICFALGYEVIYIQIIANGLKPDESAIFTVSKERESEDTEETNFRVIMTGKRDKTSISKMIAVTAGKWTIKEEGWNWTYEIIPTNDLSNYTPEEGEEEIEEGDIVLDTDLRLITKNISKSINRNFVFTNTKTIENDGSPLNHEAIVIKVIGNTASQ